MTELPKEDDVEQETENEARQKDFDTGVEPPSGKDRQMTRLQVNQNFRSRKLFPARWNWTIH